MVAVPILAKSGDVIGVVVLHTEAPREFDDDVLNFLVHTASLVGGRDRERPALRGDPPAGAGAHHAHPAEPGARRRSPCGRTSTTSSPAAPASCCAPTPARSTASTPRRDELVLAGSDPDGAPAPSPRPGGTGLVLDLMRRANGRGRERPPPGRAGAVAGRRRERAPGRAAGRPRRAARGPLLPGPRPAVQRRGRRAARRGRQPDGGRAEEGRADRAADGGEHRQGHVRRARRRLGGGRGGEGERGALRPRRPHLFLHVERAPRRRATAGRRGPSSRPGSRPGCGGSTRGRSSTPATTGCGRWRRCRTGESAVVERLRAACEPLAARGGAGGRAERGRPRRGERPAADARGRRRRAHRPLAGRRGRRGLPTSSSAPTATSSTSSSTRRRATATALAVEKLDDYDRRRGAQLVETLEQFLADRGSVTASARALYVHPNTVRQRLERIERVAELDLLERGPALAGAGAEARATAPCPDRAGASRAWPLGVAGGRRRHRQPDPEDPEADAR